MNKFKLYIILIPISLYLVLLPVLQFDANAVIDLYDNKRLLQLVIVGWILGLSCFYLINKNILYPRILDSLYFKIVTFFIVGIGTISTITALYPIWSYLELAHIIGIVLCTICISTIIQDDVLLVRKILNVTVIAFAGFYLLRFSLGYILQIKGGFPLWPGESYNVGLIGFSHVRFFNQLQTWTLPILIMFIFQVKHTSLKTFLTIFVGLFWMLVFASGARGTFLSIIISFFMLIYFFRSDIREFVIISLNSILVGLVSYWFLFKFLSKTTFREITREGTSGRFDVWLDLIPKILESPFFGHGPMHYGVIEYQNTWGHPHNWFLQYSYEWGIIVAILIGLFVCYALYRYIGKTNSAFNNERISLKVYLFRVGLFWSLLSAFLHSFLSGVHVMPLSQVWFMFVGGVALSFHYKKDGSIQDIKKIKRINYFLIGMIMISVIGYANWFIKHGIDTDSYSQKNKGEVFSKKMYPRFWQQGKFGEKEKEIELNVINNVNSTP